MFYIVAISIEGYKEMRDVFLTYKMPGFDKQLLQDSDFQHLDGYLHCVIENNIRIMCRLADVSDIA